MEIAWIPQQIVAGARNPMVVAGNRVRALSKVSSVGSNAGGVVYWMSRDQRIQDNWALLHARSLALSHGVGLSVVFCLVPTFSEATIRHYGFMLRGLKECETELRSNGVPFKLLQGDPVKTLPEFAREHDVSAIVTDFAPTRINKIWKDGVCRELPKTPVFEVDAHNIVPVWVASDKQEVGARTIRKKINDKLPQWLKDIPPFEPLEKGGDSKASESPANDESSASSSTTLSEALSRMQEATAAADKWDEDALGEALDVMEEVSVTREQLAETGAGKAVNEVAKCKSGTKPLRERAKALVAKWKEAVAKARAESDAGGGTRAMPNLPLQHGCPSLLAACEKPTDWAAVRKGLTVDMSVPEVDWCTPGSAAALVALDAFIKERLRIFAEKRNDPNVHASSDLSPYLHFGQLSAQRMALTVKKSGGKSEGIASFLEEAVVRRELSDNFVFYQPNYDSLDGAAGWARDSLELHAKDKREHVYTLEQLDKAQTHEDLWNAAQRQMVATGKMHGFMRMYWAKKILEWSPSPAEAHKRAIYLNDRYSLDGRDPNGYVGIGWAIMGTHDMGWTERAIFGKIRFMNYNGCKRKFDIARYVAKWGAKGPVVFPSSSSKKEDDNAPAAKKQKQ